MNPEAKKVAFGESPQGPPTGTHTAPLDPRQAAIVARNRAPDLDQYDRDWWTAEAMRQKGGSFVSALGNAYAHADPDNTRRIKDTWPEYWSQYEKIGKMLRAADRANEDD